MSLALCKIFLVLYFVALLQPSRAILNGTSAAETVDIYGEQYFLDYSTRYPYVVEILRKKLHLCGGALIGKNIVITVARCLSMNETVPDLREYSLLAGNQIRQESQPDFVQTRSVEKAILHPNWPQNGDADVAILKTSSDFILTNFVSPISILQKFTDENNGYVFGWGFTENKVYSHNLLHSWTWVLNSSTCTGLSNGEGQFCLEGEYNETPCHGDFGGPIIFIGNSLAEDLLMGLFTFNVGAKEPGNPSKVNCEYSKWGTGVNATYFQHFINASITTLLSP